MFAVYHEGILDHDGFEGIRLYVYLCTNSLMAHYHNKFYLQNDIECERQYYSSSTSVKKGANMLSQPPFLYLC